jgi:HAMP domain-containing protein
MDYKMDLHSNSTVPVANDTLIKTEEYGFIQTQADFAIAVSTIDGVAILFGAAINLAVIITIVKNHQKLKNMDLFVLNLCISDFTSSILYQPLIITRLLARSKLSKFHNSLFKMATFTCLLTDCAALFLVTFDKYLGIRYPLKYRTNLTKRKVVVTITCAWVVAASVGLTFALNENSAMIAGILYALLILLMFITTTALQIASFFIAKRHERRIREMGTVAGNYNNSGKPETTVNIGANEERRPEATVFSVNNPVRPFTSKAAKTITLLSTVFIISWLPQIVLNMYFTLTFDWETFFRLIYIFVAFQQLHVCINPFIYVFRTQCIRSRFFGKRNEIGELSRSGTEYGSSKPNLVRSACTQLHD